ncbi:MAG: FAD-dependent oxidoreductase, partial [Vicinamibacterales bacterium]
TDARRLPTDTQLRGDVCIIGGGAAGITLARSLRARRLSTIVLESGGLDRDPVVQALAHGTTESSSLPSRYLSTSRLRYFGGSTNHWNGMCRPLDPIDFESRAWVPYSGWPIRRRDLDRYYHAAAPLLQFEAYDASWGEVTSAADSGSLIAESAPFRGRTFRMSPPTRFGRVYRDELAAAPNVDVVLHASALRLDLNEAGVRVTRVQAATLAGNRLTVEAGIVVLAAGGIENARLLLVSDTVQRDGIGNGTDWVGRGFMEHPELGGLTVAVTDHAIFGDLFRQRHTMLCLSEQTQRQHEILSVNVQFTPDGAPEPSQSGGIVDLSPIFKALDRRAATVVDPLPDYLSCYIRAESAPRRENRITLDAHDTDALGVRRAHLRFTMGELETRTITRTVDLLAREFGGRAAGRIRFAHPDAALSVPFGEPPWRNLQHGSHHMGTPRMSESPLEGVVDPRGQGHGVSNLFVAGSSVFPTCGMANPTYTIVALALRLSDHVGEASER